MNATTRTMILAALGGMLSAPTLGQQEPPRDPPPVRQEGAPDQGPGFRDRLQRQLDEIAEEQKRLSRAIDLLDKGASRDEIMAALRPPEAGADRPDSGDRPRDRWRERRDGRGGGDGDRFPGPDWRDPQQREKVMTFIRENLPEVADRFEQIKATNPEFADRIASRIGPRVMEIMALQEREPDFAKLKLAELGNGLAIIEAFKDARDAKDDPEKLKLARANLAARVADQFEIRTRLRQREIDKLRDRLDRLQSELEQKTSQRDQEIQKSVDDMMSGKMPMDILGDGPGRGPRRGPDEPGERRSPDGPPPARGDEPPPPPR